MDDQTKNSVTDFSIEKLIASLIDVLDLSSEHKAKLMELIMQMIFLSVLIKIAPFLSEGEIATIQAKLEDTTLSDKTKLALFITLLHTNDQAQVAAKKYITEELPGQIQRIIKSYLDSADSEKVEKYLRLISESSFT